MRLPSIEELAENWNLSHTIAVAAWTLVVVLGLAVFVRSNTPTYPATGGLKVYAAENATFKYPDNWKVNDCSPEKPFMQLPGYIKSDYKGKKGYRLEIYGAVAFECVTGRPERLDLYSETIEASDEPCAPGTSTKGEKLKNGLYLQLQIMEEQVYAVHIKQNSCYAPSDTVVIGFAFTDPKEKEGDFAKYGAPWVDKEAFLKSRQYQDIKALAESIAY